MNTEAYGDALDAALAEIQRLTVAHEQALTNAYAEGRKDEAEEQEAASLLIDAWVASHGAPIPWAKAVEITAVVGKLTDAERQRLLDLD